MLAEGTAQQASITSERAKCLGSTITAPHECLLSLTMLIHDSFSLEREHEEQEEQNRCDGRLEEARTEQQIQQRRRPIRRTKSSPMRLNGEHERVCIRSIEEGAVGHRQCSGEAAAAAATAAVRLQRRVGGKRRRQRQTMLTATSSDRHVCHCCCQ